MKPLDEIMEQEKQRYREQDDISRRFFNKPKDNVPEHVKDKDYHKSHSWINTGGSSNAWF